MAACDYAQGLCTPFLGPGALQARVTTLQLYSVLSFVGSQSCQWILPLGHHSRRVWEILDDMIWERC